MPFRGGQRLKAAYQAAQQGGYAFMANNIAELNIFLGLAAAYVEERSDLLVQISPGAAKFAGSGNKLVGLRALCAMIHELSSALPIDVFINLDHFTASEIDVIRVAIDDHLVSSIMIDASVETFDENVRITREVVGMAEGSEILIEAELGKIKGVEDEISSDESLYTDPSEAVEFMDRSQADLLAVSVGTQHGVSKGRELDLRVDLVAQIRDHLRAAEKPALLVLHGSSGLLEDQVRAMIQNGICKLNKDTHYQYVYGRTACRFYEEHASEILPPQGVEDDVLNLFAGSEWSPNKKRFDPRAVGREIQAGIGDIARALIAQAGSGGKTRFGSEESAP